MTKQTGSAARRTAHSDRQLALVLWNGGVGGAEVLSVSLAESMRRLGADVTIVFIEQPFPLARRLSGLGIPHRSLGFRRGRDVLLHPRRYASGIQPVSRDGALLIDCGFIGGALRAGGYRGTIVGVEHGSLLGVRERSRIRRLLWRLARASGAWANDTEVAVSDFLLREMAGSPHARALQRIYNGVNPSDYTSEGTRSSHPGNESCSITFAGRLVHGKGCDYLIRAMARIQAEPSTRLLVAGEGPKRQQLESLSQSLGIAHVVEFLGLVHDMPELLRASDIVVVPSAEFVESCPMTPLEAMASGKPVITTLNGGLPEVVLDGETGTLVPRCDEFALADAIRVYASDSKLRRAHGQAGQMRVMRHFHIDQCAREYLQLFGGLAEG
jgi:glycosyltransferase involved in cell wall biosynthesis